MTRLVIRPGAIGDTLVSLPAIQFLAPSEIWAPTVNLPLLNHLAPARSLVWCGLDALELSPATLARLAAFDEVVSWYGTARDDFRAQVARLNFRFLPALPPAGCGVHAVDYYLEQVGAAPGAVPRLPVARPTAGFAFIHPFSGSAKKNWPLKQFQAVADGLEMPVVWCAGPTEPLPGALHFEALDALAAHLAGASVYLGNDSGVSHLAAACGVPVIALFGPSDPRVWAPRGSAPVCVLPFETPIADVIAAARSLRR